MALANSILACLALAAAHPTSVSSTRVDVAGARIDVRIRCEDQTLRECLPVDSNGDERIDAAELAAAHDEITHYILAGWRLSDADGGAIAGELVGLDLVPDSSPRKVDVVLRFDAASTPSALHIDFALFRESDPFHRDQCEVAWNGGEPSGRLLWIEDPSWDVAPSTSSSAFDTLGAFMHHGVEHILLGYDHIAFVVALVLGARRRRSVLAVVTAFTVAHSITLALAAFRVVTLPAALVEPAIALSIAWVAARNLWQKDGRTPWIEAFLFGLIHGLGFAGAIGETLASEPRKLSALVGFNLGVEFGQVAVVAALLAVFALVRAFDSSPARSRRERSPETIAPRWLTSAASFVVAVLGVYWFVQRVAG